MKAIRLSPLTLLVSAASFPESSNEGFCCKSQLTYKATECMQKHQIYPNKYMLYDKVENSEKRIKKKKKLRLILAPADVLSYGRKNYSNNQIMLQLIAGSRPKKILPSPFLAGHLQRPSF